MVGLRRDYIRATLLSHPRVRLSQFFARQLHLIGILWRLSKGVCLSNLSPPPFPLTQATRPPQAFMLTKKNKKKTTSFTDYTFFSPLQRRKCRI